MNLSSNISLLFWNYKNASISYIDWLGLVYSFYTAVNCVTHLKDLVCLYMKRNIIPQLIHLLTVQTNWGLTTYNIRNYAYSFESQ